MNIEIDESEAQTHMEAYSKIIGKLGSSGGIKWKYDWCQMMKSTSFLDILSGDPHDADDVRNKDIQTRLSEIEPNVRCDSWGSLGRRNSRVSLDKVPAAVMDTYRKNIEEEIADIKRFDSLSDAEKDAETEELIKEFRKMGGFFLRVPGN
jgi:hypothetical protein